MKQPKKAAPRRPSFQTKQITSLLLASLLLLGMLFTGGCARLDTTGLLESAPALIAASASLNEIYYGAGIPYEENAAGVTGNYYPADPDYLENAGFSTITELREMTREVFSAAYSEILFSYALEGFAAEGVGYLYARYSSSQAENLRDENETILVNSQHTGTGIGQSVYDYSSLKIGEVGKDHATVTLSVTTTFAPTEEDPDGQILTADMEIRFVYEFGWRIDSPTY